MGGSRNESVPMSTTRGFQATWDVSDSNLWNPVTYKVAQIKNYRRSIKDLKISENGSCGLEPG